MPAPLAIPAAMAAKGVGAKIGGAALKALGSKAAGVFATQAGITGMNQLLADRAFRKEKQWWKEQFDYSAKYDSPAEQMKRMKEAGLNPALMYGGSGSIEGAPSPTGSGPEAAQIDMGPLALVSAQVENIKKDTALKQAQQVLEINKGKLTSSQARVAEGLVQTNMDLAKSQLDLKKEELVGKKIDNYIKNESKAEAVKNIVYSLMNAQATLKGQKLKNVEQQKLNELLEIGITPGGVIGDVLTFLGNIGLNIYKQF